MKKLPSSLTVLSSTISPPPIKMICHHDDAPSLCGSGTGCWRAERSAGLSAAAAVVGSAITIVTVAATTVMQL